MNNLSIKDGIIMLTWEKGSKAALLTVRAKDIDLTAPDLEVLAAAFKTASEEVPGYVLEKQFMLQRQNYIDLSNAILGLDGTETIAGPLDPFKEAIRLRTENKAMRALLKTTKATT